jgi:hypothetical protein
MLRKLILGLAGVIFIAVTLELLFRILPVSTSTETGYYTDPLILNYPPHHRWTASTGWDLKNPQTLEANNWGYVSSRDFERSDQAIALIGDSFVEASMLAAHERPGNQLEKLVGTRPVFSMGIPGTALLDYAERIRFAHLQFGINDFVVLMERGDVLQSLCGSGNVHGPCLDPVKLTPRTEITPSADALKRLLRRLSVAQYLVSQLKFSQHQFVHPLTTKPATRDTNSNATLMPAVETVTNTFFRRIKPHVLGRLVIIIDSDRAAIQQGKASPDPLRDRFIELARSAGATVIDTEPLFRAHYAQSSLKVEVGPQDKHLNRLGLALILKAAAQAL